MATLNDDDKPDAGDSDSGAVESPSDPEAPTRRSKLGDRPEVFKSTMQEVLFIFVVTMSVAMQAFLSGVVNVIATFVGKSLDMTTAEITWINAAAGLSSGAFLLFFGRFADFFGRKLMFIISLGIFTALSVGAGFSQNGITLDILSGLMGLMSASSLPAALGLLGRAYSKPSKRKNYAFAAFGAGNPLGFVFGAIMAGIATQVASWRATFWALAVIYFLATAIALLAVPPDRDPKKSFSRETLKEFDAMGALLTVSGIALFATALTQGSEAPQGWRTPYVIVLLILGVLLMAAFVFWERWFSHPLIPLKMFRDRNFSLLLVILSLGFMSFPVSLFFISLYMQYVWKYSPIMVAVHLLPAAVMGTLYNVIAGALLHRISNKLLMGIGAIAYTGSFLLTAINREGDSYWAFFFPALFFMVMGADFQFNVCNMYIMQSRPRDEQSLAGGILQTATKLSITVGFGVATAIYESVRANPPTSGFYGGNAAAPYAWVFWYATICCGISVCLVPFLTIGTQGNAAPIPPSSVTRAARADKEDTKLGEEKLDEAAAPRETGFEDHQDAEFSKEVESSR